MDDSLRSLERRLQAVPDDLTARAEYLQALARTHSRPDVAEHLDRVEGALYWPRAVNLDHAAPDDAWSRTSQAWLPPTAPGGSWRAAWRQPGAPRWLSSRVALVTSRRGTLRAIHPSSGLTAWEVESQRGLEDETPTTSVLYSRVGWAVAPWGAVEVVLRRELEWQLERPSRDDDRERVDVAHTEFTLELTVVDPGPEGWSREAPAVHRFRAEPGDELGGILPPLEGSDDDVLALALDEAQPLIALRWRDEDEDWAVWRLADGDLTPEPWSFAPGDRPFAATWRPEPLLVLRETEGEVEVCGLPHTAPGPRVPRSALEGRSLSPSPEGPKGARALVQGGWLYLALGDDALLALAPVRVEL